MKNYFFKLENLSFGFDNSQSRFFQNISLELESQKLYFLRGKNGTGKSTLFRIISGSIERQEQLQGTLILNNKSYNLSSTKSRLEYSNFIKTVVQKIDTMIADDLSFHENLQLAALNRYPGLSNLPAINIPNIVQELILDQSCPVRLLSGGQRQILSILMVLQKPTSLLLLDEPTAAIDDDNARLIMHFLQNLIQENDLTALIISHDDDIIKEFAYKCLILEKNFLGQRMLNSITV